MTFSWSRSYLLTAFLRLVHPAAPLTLAKSHFARLSNLNKPLPAQLTDFEVSDLTRSSFVKRRTKLFASRNLNRNNLSSFRPLGGQLALEL